MPTISPLADVEVDVRAAGRPQSPRQRSRTSSAALRLARAGAALDRARPTISSTSAVVVELGALDGRRRTRPSRSTVARSATCEDLLEAVGDVDDRLARRRRSGAAASSSSVDLGAPAARRSARRAPARRRALSSWSCSARAIATIVCVARTELRPVGVSGAASMSKRSSTSRGARRAPRASAMRPPARRSRSRGRSRGSRRPSARERSSVCWWTKCSPARAPAPASVERSVVTLAARSRARAGVAGSTPARILISVDLPEPLPPSRAWIVPRSSSRDTSSRARVAPNAFDSPVTASIRQPATAAAGDSKKPAVSPPSSEYTAPVVNAPAGPARWHTTAATSTGFANRPSGIRDR